MGLDIGVVKISYLDSPDEPVSGFLRALAAGAFFDESWGGGWAGNAFVEFERERLNQEADAWAQDRSIGAAQRDALTRWLNDLPWEGDTIMLHISC